MRLLNQACEALIQKYSDNPSEYINLMYQHIERCGRTCYRSSDKITEDSAKPFVERMIKSNHTAMLEHGTVYLKIPFYTYYEKGNTTETKTKMVGNYFLNKYSKAVSVSNYKSQEEFADLVLKDEVISWIYATTNLRVIAENNWWDDLQYLCEPTEHHEKRYTLLCTTALHCYKDLTRHRTMSFAIESTRYCNYTKDKFGGELSFIVPTWYSKENERYFKKYNTLPVCADDKYESCLPEMYYKSGSHPSMQDVLNWTPEDYLKFNCLIAEWNYNHLIEEGWQAQQAAEVLPQCIKGDMIITGFEDDWKHLLDLRYYGTTGAPHPMVKELAALMKEELEKLGFNY